ncbi:MAG TPA: hypothetical protein VMD91_08055 [Candidatus Sulfotelmatobacter sp.]|nr:hypothetical protein [Candidatus Sulfotelmatobacter sp.]
MDVYDVKDTLVGEIEFGGTSGLTLYNSSGAVITEPNGPAATNVLTYRGFTAAEIDTAVENEAGTTTRTSLSDATEEGVEVALGRFLIQSYEAQQQTVALTDVYSAMGQYAGSFGVDDVNGVIASWGDGEEEDLTTVADQRGRFRFGPVNDNSTTDGVLAEHISRHELL